MKTSIALSFILTSTLLLATSPETLVHKGNQASSALLQKLGSELKTHMQTNGAIDALKFCSLNALSLTEEISKSENVTLKRISQKNRNPVNKPTLQEEKLLAQWEQLLFNNQSLPPYAIAENRYYKPIIIQNEACLKCHGNVEGELAKAIKENYPEDKAMGYKMGDLRGMIMVEVK